MSISRLFVLVAAVVFGQIGAVTSAIATGDGAGRRHWVCADGQVSVTATSQHAAGMVCEQAGRARQFLAACGVTSSAPLQVTIAGRPGRELDAGRAGTYDPSTGRVRLLAFTRYAQIAKTRFGASPSLARELHASVAAHEIAHGIFYDYTRGRELPETAHEYVAYAVQFAVLPETVRASLLAREDIRPSSNLFTFSFFLLAADPELFALHAWRHFEQPENGCSFLKKVVDGEVHFPPHSD